MEVPGDPAVVADGKLSRGTLAYELADKTSRPVRDKSWSQGSNAPGLPQVLGAMLILAFSPLLQVLGPKSHDTQHSGHGLWWPHISVQSGGAGLGSVDLGQAPGTGEGAESLGLPGHCHGVGPHCAAGHHLGPGLLLLQCVPAASALPFHHLQLTLR